MAQNKGGGNGQGGAYTTGATMYLQNQGQPEIRKTSGEGMMCLIHAIFPDAKDLYGNVSCNGTGGQPNASARLLEIKDYVLHRIGQLREAVQNNALQQLNPPITTQEINALQGLYRSDNIEQEQEIDVNQFYDSITWETGKVNIRGEKKIKSESELNLAKIQTNKKEFQKLLNAAQQSVNEIQEETMNDGSLCYYIAQRYNIGINLYNLNGVITEQYIPTNSETIKNILGQPGHFSAMLTDAEFQRLKLQKNDILVFDDFEMINTTKRDKLNQFNQLQPPNSQKNTAEYFNLGSGEQERKNYNVVLDDIYNKIKGNNKQKLSEKVQSLINTAEDLQKKAKEIQQNQNNDGLLSEENLSKTKNLRYMQLSFVRNEDEKSEETLKNAVEQAKRLKLIKEDDSTDNKKIYDELFKQKEAAKEKLKEKLNGYKSKLFSGKTVTDIQDINFADGYNTVETARNTNFIVTLSDNSEMYVGVSDNGQRTLLAVERYQKELGECLQELNGMQNVQDVSKITALEIQIKSIERHLGNVHCGNPWDAIEKVETLKTINQEFRPQHVAAVEDKDWKTSICATTAYKTNKNGYQEVANTVDFNQKELKKQIQSRYDQQKKQIEQEFQEVLTKFEEDSPEEEDILDDSQLQQNQINGTQKNEIIKKFTQLRNDFKAAFVTPYKDKLFKPANAAYNKIDRLSKKQELPNEQEVTKEKVKQLIAETQSFVKDTQVKDWLYGASRPQGIQDLIINANIKEEELEKFQALCNALTLVKREPRTDKTLRQATKNVYDILLAQQASSQNTIRVGLEYMPTSLDEQKNDEEDFVSKTFNAYIKALNKRDDSHDVGASSFLSTGNVAVKPIFDSQRVYFTVDNIPDKFSQYKKCPKKEKELLEKAIKERVKWQEKKDDDVTTKYNKIITQFNGYGYKELVKLRRFLVATLEETNNQRSEKKRTPEQIKVIVDFFQLVTGEEFRYDSNGNDLYNDGQFPSDVNKAGAIYDLVRAKADEVQAFYKHSNNKDKIIEKNIVNLGKPSGKDILTVPTGNLIMDPTLTTMAELRKAYERYNILQSQLDKEFFKANETLVKGKFTTEFIKKTFNIEQNHKTPKVENYRKLMQFIADAFVTADLKPDNLGLLTTPQILATFDTNIPTKDSPNGDQFLRGLEGDIERYQKENGQIKSVVEFYKAKLRLKETLTEAAKRFDEFSNVIGQEHCYKALMKVFIEGLDKFEQNPEEYQEYLKQFQDVIKEKQEKTTKDIEKLKESVQSEKNEEIKERKTKIIGTLGLYNKYLGGISKIVGLGVQNQAAGVAQNKYQQNATEIEAEIVKDIKAHYKGDNITIQIDDIVEDGQRVNQFIRYKIYKGGEVSQKYYYPLTQQAEQAVLKNDPNSTLGCLSHSEPQIQSSQEQLQDIRQIRTNDYQSFVKDVLKALQQIKTKEIDGFDFSKIEENEKTKIEKLRQQIHSRKECDNKLDRDGQYLVSKRIFDVVAEHYNLVKKQAEQARLEELKKIKRETEKAITQQKNQEIKVIKNQLEDQIKEKDNIIVEKDQKIKNLIKELAQKKDDVDKRRKELEILQKDLQNFKQTEVRTEEQKKELEIKIQEVNLELQVAEKQLDELQENTLKDLVKIATNLEGLGERYTNLLLQIQQELEQLIRENHEKYEEKIAELRRLYDILLARQQLAPSAAALAAGLNYQPNQNGGQNGGIGIPLNGANGVGNIDGGIQAVQIIDDQNGGYEIQVSVNGQGFQQANPDQAQAVFEALVQRASQRGVEVDRILRQHGVDILALQRNDQQQDQRIRAAEGNIVNLQNEDQRLNQAIQRIDGVVQQEQAARQQAIQRIDGIIGQLNVQQVQALQNLLQNPPQGLSLQEQQDLAALQQFLVNIPQGQQLNAQAIVDLQNLLQPIRQLLARQQLAPSAAALAAGLNYQPNQNGGQNGGIGIPLNGANGVGNIDGGIQAVQIIDDQNGGYEIQVSVNGQGFQQANPDQAQAVFEALVQRASQRGVEVDRILRQHGVDILALQRNDQQQDQRIQAAEGNIVNLQNEDQRLNQAIQRIDGVVQQEQAARQQAIQRIDGVVQRHDQAIAQANQAIQRIDGIIGQLNVQQVQALQNLLQNPPQGLSLQEQQDLAALQQFLVNIPQGQQLNAQAIVDLQNLLQPIRQLLARQQLAPSAAALAAGLNYQPNQNGGQNGGIGIPLNGANGVGNIDGGIQAVQIIDDQNGGYEIQVSVNGQGFQQANPDQAQAVFEALVQRASQRGVEVDRILRQHGVDILALQRNDQQQDQRIRAVEGDIQQEQAARQQAIQRIDGVVQRHDQAIAQANQAIQRIDGIIGQLNVQQVQALQNLLQNPPQGLSLQEQQDLAALQQFLVNIPQGQQLNAQAIVDLQNLLQPIRQLLARQQLAPSAAALAAGLNYQPNQNGGQNGGIGIPLNGANGVGNIDGGIQAVQIIDDQNGGYEIQVSVNGQGFQQANPDQAQAVFEALVQRASQRGVEVDRILRQHGVDILALQRNDQQQDQRIRAVEGDIQQEQAARQQAIQRIDGVVQRHDQAIAQANQAIQRIDGIIGQLNVQQVQALQNLLQNPPQGLSLQEQQDLAALQQFLVNIPQGQQLNAQAIVDLQNLLQPIRQLLARQQLAPSAAALAAGLNYQPNQNGGQNGGIGIPLNGANGVGNIDGGIQAVQIIDDQNGGYEIQVSVNGQGFQQANPDQAQAVFEALVQRASQRGVEVDRILRQHGVDILALQRNDQQQDQRIRAAEGNIVNLQNEDQRLNQAIQRIDGVVQQEQAARQQAIQRIDGIIGQLNVQQVQALQNLLQNPPQGLSLQEQQDLAALQQFLVNIPQGQQLNAQAIVDLQNLLQPIRQLLARQQLAPSAAALAAGLNYQPNQNGGQNGGIGIPLNGANGVGNIDGGIQAVQIIDDQNGGYEIQVSVNGQGFQQANPDQAQAVFEALVQRASQRGVEVDRILRQHGVDILALQRNDQQQDQRIQAAEGNIVNLQNEDQRLNQAIQRIDGVVQQEQAARQQAIQRIDGVVQRHDQAIAQANQAIQRIDGIIGQLNVQQVQALQNLLQNPPQGLSLQEQQDLAALQQFLVNIPQGQQLNAQAIVDLQNLLQPIRQLLARQQLAPSSYHIANELRCNRNQNNDGFIIPLQNGQNQNDILVNGQPIPNAQVQIIDDQNGGYEIQVSVNGQGFQQANPDQAQAVFEALVQRASQRGVEVDRILRQHGVDILALQRNDQQQDQRIRAVEGDIQQEQAARQQAIQHLLICDQQNRAQIHQIFAQIQQLQNQQGQQGPPGAPGQNGQNGLNGNNGQQGAPGQNGINGAAGQQGPPGEQAILDSNSDIVRQVQREFEDKVKEIVRSELAQKSKAKDGRDGRDGRDVMDIRDSKRVISVKLHKPKGDITQTQEDLKREIKKELRRELKRDIKRQNKARNLEKLYAEKARIEIELAKVRAKLKALDNSHQDEQFDQPVRRQRRGLMARHPRMFNHEQPMQQMHARALHAPEHNFLNHFNNQNIERYSDVLSQSDKNLGYRKPEEDTYSRLNFDNLPNAQPNIALDHISEDNNKVSRYLAKNAQYNPEGDPYEDIRSSHFGN